MVRSCNSCSKTNRSFSSITLLVFHGMRLFYTQLPKFLQCQGCSRSILSGMCPVRTRSYLPPSPCFSQVFILKVVKVLCFDTLLQVFILKGLRCVLPSRQRNAHIDSKGLRDKQCWVACKCAF